MYISCIHISSTIDVELFCHPTAMAAVAADNGNGDGNGKDKKRQRNAWLKFQLSLVADLAVALSKSPNLLCGANTREVNSLHTYVYARSSCWRSTRGSQPQTDPRAHLPNSLLSHGIALAPLSASIRLVWVRRRASHIYIYIYIYI